MLLDDNVSDMSSYKVNIMSFKKNKVKAAYRWLQDQFANKLNVSFSHKNLLEVNLFGVNKGSALKKISKQIKVPLEKFAAIGDSNNDLPALNEVSLPIAVKTHSKELIQAAKYYLPYKKNAVADAINKYILDNENHKIKLVVSDLDGTLLRNGSKTISTSTIKSIIDAVDNHGIYFAIASGRNIDDALLVLKAIKVKNKDRLFIIAANGTVIYDPSKKQCIFQQTIEPHLAKEVFDSYKSIYDDKRHKGQMALQIYQPNDLATITKPQISRVLN
ncbi:hypothetical protein FACS1894166_05320 [Bacilli bacterium]|nr:hypothetical protein FACS1894166_05320 [Bacilli bacterium]